MNQFRLIATIPHSGEKVPDFCDWLFGLPEPTLMRDVDRYVDFLYEESLTELKIPFVKTEWHRYAADLNRLPQDIDKDSVAGSLNPSGSNNRGFHWSVTTLNEKLIHQPMSLEVHQKLVDLVYTPFHQNVKSLYDQTDRKTFPEIYHLDLHSMPSVGTQMHKDPGEVRADIVISDCLGKSSKKEFVDLVMTSYVRAGFKVGYNWPYIGGRVSEQYGRPQMNEHCVQVEISRQLYMNEENKKLKVEQAAVVQKKLKNALREIINGLES